MAAPAVADESAEASGERSGSTRKTSGALMVVVEMVDRLAKQDVDRKKGMRKAMKRQ